MVLEALLLPALVMLKMMAVLVGKITQRQQEQ